MTNAPLQRFLGVDASADAYTLLGLSEPNPMPTQIDAALRRQLARVHRHPDGQSAEGEAVRKVLRDTAEQLKKHAVAAAQSPQPPGKSTQHTAQHSVGRPRAGSVGAKPRSTFARRLTEFDRAVLAVLVGCGGWNTESRSRLVALASMYGVSVHGLMRVVSGLTEYARRGGPPIAVADITSGAPRMAAPMSRARNDAMDATTELVTRLMPEFQEDTLSSRVKIAALFALVFLISLIAFVRLLLPEEPDRVARMQTPVTAPTPAPDAGAPAQPTPATTPPQRSRLASFEQPPTFLGAGLPVEVTNAADEAVTLPQHLDDIARTLTVADDDPSDAVLQNWNVSINTMATGWILADEATLSAVDEGILECLYAAANHPTVTDTLLGELIPPSGRLAEPVDIVRGSWKAGMLGRISSANVPPAVTQRANDSLGIAVPAADPRPESFDDAARAWLHTVLPTLVERTNYEDKVFDYWELWLSAVRSATDPRDGAQQRRSYEATLMNALHAVAAQSTDLTTDSRATAVVGRLIDVLDLRDSAIVRNRMLALFDDEAISTQDLWIITSIAVQFEHAPWLKEELVLPADADAPHRRRMADKWQSAWPEPLLSRYAGQIDAAQGLSVDADLFERWQRLLNALSEPLADATNIARMQRLVHISRLNEAAAAMLKQNVGAAEPMLDELADALLKSDSTTKAGQTSPGGGPVATPARPAAQNQQPPRGISRLRPGQPIGQDGGWAAQYEEAGRNTTDRLDLLSALRNNAGTDLGPIDARVFVGEVYRGTPQEVRELAQSILIQQFARGPNVALEMLDQFIRAPSMQSTSDTIAQLTGAILPSTSAPSWEAQTRLALVQHVLGLLPAAQQQVDVLTDALTQSYLARLKLASRNALPTTMPETARDASERLRESWQHVASMLIASNPTPGELPVLARRHTVRLRLSTGPIQEFVANQIAIGDLLAYVVTAEKPYLSEHVNKMLNASVDERSNAIHVLDQAIDAELNVAQLWRLRMGAPPVEGAS